MKKILFASFFMTLNLCVFAQNTLNAVVRNSENKDPLIGVTASIKGISRAATSNESGLITISNIPDGLQEIQLSYRSEEHTSELQSLMRISYAVFCLKKKQKQNKNTNKYNINKKQN